MRPEGIGTSQAISRRDRETAPRPGFSLPLLPTHLSFPQIAAELFLSPHTIKSEMKSIYRKLGASTRTQAVTRSRELGFLEV